MDQFDLRTLLPFAIAPCVLETFLNSHGRMPSNVTIRSALSSKIGVISLTYIYVNAANSLQLCLGPKERLGKNHSDSMCLPDRHCLTDKFKK